MEKIYRIFVSSTFEDLREERAEVQKALLKLKCLPVGMELFPSTDDETWEFIQRQIDESDYYILIVAGRYGSVAADGFGFTEKEYNYAKMQKKPTLAFIHADRSKIEAGKTEMDPERRLKLEAFIAKVRSGPLVQTFASPHELSGQVLISMVDLRERRPAIGFIRADEIVEAKKYADLLEENARLKAELSSMSGLMPKTFFGSETSHTSKIVTTRKGKSDGEFVKKDMTATWGQIFMVVANQLVTSPSCTDYHVGRSLLSLCDENLAEIEVDFCGDEFEKIKKTLYARQLVTFDTNVREIGIRQVRRNYHVWRLTDYGREQYGILVDAG